MLHRALWPGIGIAPTNLYAAIVHLFSSPVAPGLMEAMAKIGTEVAYLEKTIPFCLRVDEGGRSNFYPLL